MELREQPKYIHANIVVLCTGQLINSVLVASDMEVYSSNTYPQLQITRWTNIYHTFPVIFPWLTILNHLNLWIRHFPWVPMTSEARPPKRRVQRVGAMPKPTEASCALRPSDSADPTLCQICDPTQRRVRWLATRSIRPHRKYMYIYIYIRCLYIMVKNVYIYIVLHYTIYIYIYYYAILQYTKSLYIL